MMRIIFSVIFVLSIIGTVTAFAVNSKTKKHIWRYRITVEVETPEGVKSGSSVWEVKLEPAKIAKLHGFKDHYRGDAVMVDLGKRGYLFALKKDPSSRQYIKTVLFNMFPSTPPVGKDKFKFYDNLKSGRAVVPEKLYPTFVYLRDIDNPKTIEAVYDRHTIYSGDVKTVKVNRIEEIYGQGVRIKSVKIEITDDPVEFSIQQTLVWLLESENTYFLESPPISKSQPLQYLDFQEGRIE